MYANDSLKPNTTAWLVYNPKAPFPEAEIVQHFSDFDDTHLVPLYPEAVVPSDEIVTLTVDFKRVEDINYAIVNDVNYVAPKDSLPQNLS